MRYVMALRAAVFFLWDSPSLAGACPPYAGGACDNGACAAATCQDYPGWVQDRSSHNCATFAQFWCDGCGYVSSHEPTGTGGLYAHQACCACGGGRYNATAPLANQTSDMKEDVQ